MGLQDGGAFTGPDTSVPFEKNVSKGDVAREEYKDLPTEIGTIKGAEDLPSVAVPVEDGVIKSMGTGIVESGKVPIVQPAPKNYLTQTVPTEPVELLPKGTTISRVTGKVKGIEVPAEFAAVGAAATAFAGYKLLTGTSKLGSSTAIFGSSTAVGPGGIGTGARSVYGAGAGATAAQVIGGGAAVLSLYDMYKNGLSIENGLKPYLVMPGVLVVESEDVESVKSKLEHLELEGIALITLVDDSAFVAEDISNWLWVTFTRSNPAEDIFGLEEEIQNKHWHCRIPIIDARVKPHHAPDKIFVSDTSSTTIT